MQEMELNQSTSLQPVFYIGVISLLSNHLASLEFKFSDAIKFHWDLYGV